MPADDSSDDIIRMDPQDYADFLRWKLRRTRAEAMEEQPHTPPQVEGEEPVAPVPPPPPVDLHHGLSLETIDNMSHSETKWLTAVLTLLLQQRNPYQLPATSPPTPVKQKLPLNFGYPE